jgi:gamma-glutamyl-gamma-aminobutyrate hydrolase PuuD
VPEALEDPEQDFCLGVQWHPELGGEGAENLFAAFVSAARNRVRIASNSGETEVDGR